MWMRPELGILGLVGLTAGIVRGADLYVPLPLGGLYFQDVVLLGLFGLLALRALMYDGLRIDWGPVSRPLLVFLFLSVASVVYAVGFREVELPRALNELRPIAYYGAAIVTAMTLTHPSHRTTLLIGLFVLADIITTALILQQFVGAGHWMLPGMVDWQVNEVGSGGVTDDRRDQSSAGVGLLRIVPPAHLLLFFIMILAFLWALAPGLRRPARAVCALQCGFLNIGLLLTYTRAQWIASVISFIIIAALVPRVLRVRLARGLLVVLGLCLFALGLVQAGIPLPGADHPAIPAMVARATSVLSPSETLSSSSLQWRGFEIETGLRSLLESPQGVGLGNAYRAVTTYAGEAAGYQGEPLNRFMHNSYLYIAVKTGVLGLATFLWFCLAFVANGWRLFRGMPDGPERWLVLTMVACFVGVMQWCFFEPNFMLPGSAVVVGLMVGLAASLTRQPARASDHPYRVEPST
jgi:O-antigen ligase